MASSHQSCSQGALRHSTSSSSLGHFKGLLNIYSKEADINHTVNVGSLINNNVSLDKISNYKYHSLVSNNDYCLYSCDILNDGTVNIKSDTNLGFAVNHASLSPDKKLTIACGDSKRIVLLHEGQPNHQLEVIGSKSSDAATLHKRIYLKTSYDSGISTLFNSDGKQFCCAFQDGVTLVYDVRNYKLPLHTIYSTRPKSQHGAFRCCKFSGGTDDLLMISEHTGRVHLIDTRNFSKHQVILLPKLVFSPGDSLSDGVYHEPLIREYQDALTSYNGMSDSNIRYNINSDYLYLANGIMSEYSTSSVRFDHDIDENENKFYEEEGDLANNLDYENWSELDQETSIESQRVSDPFFTNSNNLFFVNNHFAGRRVVPSRLNVGDSNYHLMYDDSLIDINGVDWYCDDQTGKSHLLVGCDKGLFRWEVDSWSRRCFPSFEIC